MGVSEISLAATSSGGRLLSGLGSEIGEPLNKTMRLLVVDNAPTCAGIRIALSGEVEICAEAGDAETAIRAAKREQPDIALVGTGISPRWAAAIQGICRAAPGYTAIHPGPCLYIVL